MNDALSRDALEAAFCWEADDLVRSRPAMTAFRQSTRLHQAHWREAHGHPIGTQPIAPRPGGPPGRPVGNRLPVAYARESGASLLTPGALSAARERTSFVEREQSFDHQRFWADLLWSPTLAFNLFGDLAADLALADRAVHAWWPDAPGVVREVRFAHSPGRLDPAYLNSLVAFDVAFVLDVGDGTQAVIGVDARYHERLDIQQPKPKNLWRYTQVAERSGAFAPGALDAVTGRSELAVTWLEHLLLNAMLQHERGAWSWGRYVVIHPTANPDMSELCVRYRRLLADASTFASTTIEALLDAGVLSAATAAALRERYLPGRA